MAFDLASAPTRPFRATPIHRAWLAFAGEWTGRATLWLEPGAAGQESDTQLLGTMLLGGRALRLEYAGIAGNTVNAGEMLLAYNPDSSAVTVAWMDSWHNGPALMVCAGTSGEHGEIDVLGSYDAGGEKWGWRITLAREGNALVLRMFNRTPAGEESPAVEAKLKRA